MHHIGLGHRLATSWHRGASCPNPFLRQYSLPLHQRRDTRLTLFGKQHVTTTADQERNFLVVDDKTETSAIEATFDSFTERKDIAIVLINQHVRLCS